MSKVPPSEDLPLCVDMDGTLLKTDSLHELAVRVLKLRPWILFLLPLWLMRGKHVLKRELARRCRLDVATLPYNQEFLAFLRTEKQRGRQLFLATGAYQDIAQAVADYTGLFDGVFATDATQNLTGKRKAALLVETFGDKGFAYAGNDMVDVPVWENARSAYLVNATPATASRASKQFTFAGIMDPRSGFSPKILLKAVRLHQWAKNGLVFVPLLASHHLLDFNLLLDTCLAFLAFGCCASFSYIINDIGDLDADRKHHSKHKRPFASSVLSIPAGLLLASLLLGLTALIALLLPAGFIYCLLVYFVATNAYTLRLKYVPILDVSILAGLYTLRVIAGSYAVDIDNSFWLLAFSCFIFFSLAIVKRLSELLGIKKSGGKAVMCRGYWTSDIPVLTSLGTASSMMAVLVLALYINSPDIVVLYASPRYLWLMCPIIALWLGRVWLITGRGLMHDDPVVFALRDRISWLLFGLAGLLMLVGAKI